MRITSYSSVQSRSRFSPSTVLPSGGSNHLAEEEQQHLSSRGSARTNTTSSSKSQACYLLFLIVVTAMLFLTVFREKEQSQIISFQRQSVAKAKNRDADHKNALNNQQHATEKKDDHDLPPHTASGDGDRSHRVDDAAGVDEEERRPEHNVRLPLNRGGAKVAEDVEQPTHHTRGVGNVRNTKRYSNSDTEDDDTIPNQKRKSGKLLGHKGKKRLTEAEVRDKAEQLVGEGDGVKLPFGKSEDNESKNNGVEAHENEKEATPKMMARAASGRKPKFGDQAPLINLREAANTPPDDPEEAQRLRDRHVAEKEKRLAMFNGVPDAHFKCASSAHDLSVFADERDQSNHDTRNKKAKKKDQSVQTDEIVPFEIFLKRLRELLNTAPRGRTAIDTICRQWGRIKHQLLPNMNTSTNATLPPPQPPLTNEDGSATPSEKEAMLPSPPAVTPTNISASISDRSVSVLHVGMNMGAEFSKLGACIRHKGFSGPIVGVSSAEADPLWKSVGEEHQRAVESLVGGDVVVLDEKPHIKESLTQFVSTWKSLDEEADTTKRTDASTTRRVSLVTVFERTPPSKSANKSAEDNDQNGRAQSPHPVGISSATADTLEILGSAGLLHPGMLLLLGDALGDPSFSQLRAVYDWLGDLAARGTSYGYSSEAAGGDVDSATEAALRKPNPKQQKRRGFCVVSAHKLLHQGTFMGSEKILPGSKAVLLQLHEHD